MTDNMPACEFGGYMDRDTLSYRPSTGAIFADRPERDERNSLAMVQMGDRKSLMAEYKWPT